MVSSAKSLVLLLIESGISFMYMRKRQGPKTEPWGTPERTGQESECSPSRTTLWDLFDKNDWIHVTTPPFMPSRRSFSKSLWWSTLSKACWSPWLSHRSVPSDLVYRRGLAWTESAGSHSLLCFWSHVGYGIICCFYLGETWCWK